MASQIRSFLSKHKTILVPLIFVAFSFFGLAYLAYFNIMYYNASFSYHYGRILAVHNAIFHGMFPLISFGSKVPYGTALSFYPWITLIPFALIINLMPPVLFFYVSNFIILFGTYLISYYGMRSISKSTTNSFIFAFLYSDSSIIFDWMVNSGDVGFSLAMMFAPLVFFGFVHLYNDNRFLMLTAGIILVLLSNLVAGALCIAMVICLFAFNLRYFNLRKGAIFLISIVLITVISSLFIYPSFALSSLNHIFWPSSTHLISSGVFNNVKSTSDYIFGVVDVIGLLSIIRIHNRHFNYDDLLIWSLSVVSILLNLSFVANFLSRALPFFGQLQVTYRLCLISHLLLSVLAFKWLCGFYNSKHSHANRSWLFLVAIILILTPAFNQFDYHILMKKHPIVSISNINYLDRHDVKHLQFNMNNHSFNSLRHYHYFYNYAPSRQIINNQVFDDNYLTTIYTKHDKWLISARYHPTNTGIYIFVHHYYTNVRYPIMIYQGINYKFNLNGHLLSEHHINYKLTNRYHELVLDHLPSGKDTISLRSAHLQP